MKVKSMCKKILLALTALLILFSVTMSLSGCSCSIQTTASVSIGFKTGGGLEHGQYSESIEEFVIGERFYCSVVVKIVTNKKVDNNFLSFLSTFH